MPQLITRLENLSKEKELVENKKGTRGEKAFRLYIEDFLDSDYFRELRTSLRTKYKIPNNVPFSKENKAKYEQMPLVYIPLQLHTNNSDLKRYWAELKKDICNGVEKKLPIDDEWLILYLRLLVLHEKIPVATIRTLYENIQWPDVCKLSNDVMELTGWGGGITKDMMEGYISTRELDMGLYPLSIKFNPAVSQKQLIDFIQKNWGRIKLMNSENEPNTVLAGKRGRANSGRDKIISAHFDKPTKVIQAKLAEKGFRLTLEGIRKQKVLIRQKRKKV